MSDIPSKNANGLQIIQMCSAFSEIGHKVKLVTPNFDTPINMSIKNYYGIKNKFKLIRIGKKIKLLSRIDNIILPFKLSLYSVKNKSDLIITRNLVISFFLIIFRTKHILEIHDDLVIGGKKISWIFKEFKLLNSAKIKKIVFITKCLYNFIACKYNYKKNNFDILPDSSSIKTNNKKIIAKKKLKIGYFGSIYKSRGIEIVIKLSKLNIKNDYFIFGGTNNEIDILKTKYRTKNLKFYKQIPYSKIGNEINKMDIVLMPYTNKVTSTGDIGNIINFMSPMKMFDYLSSGKLIISSDLPVLREILKNNYNAILIKNYVNISEWRKHIDNYNFNISKIIIMQKNAQNLMKNLTWKNRAKKIINF